MNKPELKCHWCNKVIDEITCDECWLEHYKAQLEFDKMYKDDKQKDKPLSKA